MGATCVENWDIACVIVQNVRIPVGQDLNLLCKDEQRMLDPVVAPPENEISGRNFCKGENYNIPDPETLISSMNLYLACIECMYNVLNPNGTL